MRTSLAAVLAAAASLLSPVVAGFANSGLRPPAGLRTVPSRGGIAALRAAKAKEEAGQLKNVAGFFYTPAPPPRPWNAIGRIRELNLLQRTVDLGILSKLEQLGVTLEDLEAALPLADDLNLPLLAANAPPSLIGGAAFLAIESAPLVLPVLAAVLALGPPFFFVVGASAIGAEGALAASGLVVPVIDVPAANLAGVLLVPLSVVLLGAGAFLGSFKKT